MPKPVIAIVGRPNVGKSTLFNRIIGKRMAIVDATPGVTRDRNYTEAEFAGRHFLLVDTGGFEPSAKEGMAAMVREQARLAIEEADGILFLVDGKEGLNPLDNEIVRILRLTGKPVRLVVNKIDSQEKIPSAYDFFSLGLGEPVAISALHGIGVGELLTEMVKDLPSFLEEEEEKGVKVAVVGRPNVGKSSLINALLGEERVIVDELPGTTRDAVDTPFQWKGEHFLLIDTAGLRRKSRIADNIERYSVVRALRSIDRADVVILVLEATAGALEQDQKIASYVHEEGRGMVLVLNKWDLVVGREKLKNQYREAIYQFLSFVDYAPLLFVSARTEEGVTSILSLVKQVEEISRRQIAADYLRIFLEDTINRYPPPLYHGKSLRIYSFQQVGIKPPTFHLMVNDPRRVQASYLRYLENSLRQKWEFTGNPLRIIPRKK